MEKYKRLYEATKEFGVQWSEFDKNDRLVKKEKIFDSREKLDKFIITLTKKDNFNSIEAWLVK